MTTATEACLAEALGAIERGVAPADILARFPEEADALVPLLAVAAALPALGATPHPAAQAASRWSFLAQAADLRRAAARARPWPS